jgi:hypothetical protein
MSLCQFPSILRPWFVCSRQEIRQYHLVTPQKPLDWLVTSDPAIGWQTMRDLTDATPVTIAAERSRVTREGIGTEILSSQQPDGSWRRTGKPTWLSTLFTLQLLRATGIDAADPAVESTIARAETNLRWNDYPGYWDLRSPDFGPAPSDGKHGCKLGGQPVLRRRRGALHQRRCPRLGWLLPASQSRKAGE